MLEYQKIKQFTKKEAVRYEMVCSNNFVEFYYLLLYCVVCNVLYIIVLDMKWYVVIILLNFIIYFCFV